MRAKSFDKVRPDVWIGHMVLPVPDVAAERDFFAAVGMRLLEHEDRVAIMELRGGTHLILLPGGERADGDDAPFDLMVDDIDAAHAGYARAGLSPSEIADVPFHRAFTLTAPSGHIVTVNSSHASGKPV